VAVYVKKTWLSLRSPPQEMHKNTAFQVMQTSENEVTLKYTRWMCIHVLNTCMYHLSLLLHQQHIWSPALTAGYQRPCRNNAIAVHEVACSIHSCQCAIIA